MKISVVLKRLKNRFIFFGRNSGIHGLNHLFNVNGNLLSRLFWLFTLIASMGCLYLMMQPAVELGVEVNFTPDTRYLHWTTTFPGLTVCEEHTTKLALRRFAALYPDLLHPLNYDHRRYITDLLFARGQCSNAQCAPCGKTIACDVPWRSIIEHMASVFPMTIPEKKCRKTQGSRSVLKSRQIIVHKSCQEMLSECSYNDIVFPCCEYFRAVDSEHGPCFSFNTLQHNGENSLFVVNRTTGPGVLMFRLLSDAEISIHSPEELSTNSLDAKLKHVVYTYSENRVNLLFSVVEFVNDLLLQNENIYVRKCRYLHEIPNAPFHTYSTYSYGACRLAHSTKEFYQHCGCVHPVRDLAYEKNYCNYTGINCWNAYEDQKSKIGVDKNAKDDCLPSCVESELTTIHFTKRWVPEEPIKGILVEVKMVSLPTLRYQRNLLRDNLDLVVAVGGIVGLFFSASILSLLEIFYLILRPQNNQ